jgi:hypothetical protein
LCRFWGCGELSANCRQTTIASGRDNAHAHVRGLRRMRQQPH